MKHKLFFMALVAMLLSACKNSTDEPQPSEGEGHITFQVINYQQFSIDDDDDESTRVSVSNVDHLDMAIYDASTNALVSHVHQAKDADGYGAFSATLPYGTYKVVFLGYKGSRTANVDNIAAISYLDDYVPDFFSKTLDITIDKPETEARNVSLTRRVAAFKLGSRGDNPSNLSSLTIESQGGSHHFNALTNCGAQTENRSYRFDVSAKAGKDTLSVTVFTFLTDAESTMNFTATARDANENILRQRTFTNVPMCISQRTQYNGYFFEEDKSATGFTLLLEDGDFTNELYTY